MRLRGSKEPETGRAKALLSKIKKKTKVKRWRFDKRRNAHDSEECKRDSGPRQGRPGYGTAEGLVHVNHTVLTGPLKGAGSEIQGPSPLTESGKKIRAQG